MPAAFLYSNLGLDKRLNEIVMAGSHDAGITGGGGNAQTQSLEIEGQANAGVRIFDVRVALATTSGQAKGIQGKHAELKTFHANDKLVTTAQKSRTVVGLGDDNRLLERTKLRAGVWGQGLQSILQQAARFVSDNTTEFLILKFDHCSNWDAIAELCIRELDTDMYSGGGNLNTKTLEELAGKVICVFEHSAFQTLSEERKIKGILGIKNLYSGGAYDLDYAGLQYFGKGGISVFTGWRPTGWITRFQTSEHQAKMEKNEKKQKRLLGEARTQNIDAMGMMYWTATGVFGNIERRNDHMWSESGRGLLTNLWMEGIGEIVEARAPSNVNLKAMAGGAVIKQCMPNFVMIDFSDEDKCGAIFNLNMTAGVALVQAAQG